VELVSLAHQDRVTTALYLLVVVLVGLQLIAQEGRERHQQFLAHL
jgi:hypothetical protein